MDIKSETSESKKNTKPTTSFQEEKMAFKCDNCDASFSQKGKLNRHIGFLVCRNRQAVSCRKEALPKKKKPWNAISRCSYSVCVCVSASPEFWSSGNPILKKGDLNRHVISVHEGKQHFKCSVCDAYLPLNINFSSNKIELKIGSMRFLKYIFMRNDPSLQTPSFLILWKCPSLEPL